MFFVRLSLSCRFGLLVSCIKQVICKVVAVVSISSVLYRKTRQNVSVMKVEMYLIFDPC